MIMYSSNSFSTDLYKQEWLLHKLFQKGQSDLARPDEANLKLRFFLYFSQLLFVTSFGTDLLSSSFFKFYSKSYSIALAALPLSPPLAQSVVIYPKFYEGVLSVSESLEGSPLTK